MAQFDAFSPFGLFDFSSDPSPAETAYIAMQIAYGPDMFNWTQSGSNYQEAKVFAASIQIGLARVALQAARAQRSPATATDKLPTWELDYGITPGPVDSVGKRQATVAAKRLLMAGSRQEAIETDLRAVLGTGFVSLRVTKASETVPYPSVGAIPTVGSFQAPSTLPKYITITDPISQVLSQITVNYLIVAGSAPPVAGDTFTVEPNIDGVAESVTIVASFSGPFGIINTITAQFVNAHTAGCMAMTCAPMWRSNQRRLRVIMSAASASNPETRRRVHEVMARHEKSVSDWELLAASSSTQTGPFVCNVGIIGATALGDTAFTF